MNTKTTKSKSKSATYPPSRGRAEVTLFGLVREHDDVHGSGVAALLHHLLAVCDEPIG